MVKQEARNSRMFETAVGAYQSGRREVDRLINDWNERHGVHKSDDLTRKAKKTKISVDKKHRISSVCANRSDGHCQPPERV